MTTVNGTRSDLLCPLCLDVAKHPHRIVPCAHVFCEYCLRAVASAEERYMSRRMYFRNRCVCQ